MMLWMELVLTGFQSTARPHEVSDAAPGAQSGARISGAGSHSWRCCTVLPSHSNPPDMTLEIATTGEQRPALGCTPQPVRQQPRPSQIRNASGVTNAANLWHLWAAPCPGTGEVPDFHKALRAPQLQRGSLCPTKADGLGPDLKDFGVLQRCALGPRCRSTREACNGNKSFKVRWSGSAAGRLMKPCLEDSRNATAEAVLCTESQGHKALRFGPPALLGAWAAAPWSLGK